MGGVDGMVGSVRTRDAPDSSIDETLEKLWASVGSQQD